MPLRINLSALLPAKYSPKLADIVARMFVWSSRKFLVSANHVFIPEIGFGEFEDHIVDHGLEEECVALKSMLFVWMPSVPALLRVVMKMTS